MPEAVRQISHLGEDVQGNQHGSRRKNAEIGLHFLNLEGFLHPLCQKQIIKTEIHAEQEHENGDHNLKIRAVSGHAVGPDGKSAGSCGAEGGAQGIKKRHASDQEEKNLKRHHRDINAIQHQRRLAHSGNQLAHRRPRAFRPHQIHGLSAGKRNDLKQEYQHAHTADPVRKAAPEHTAAGKSLHVHQNTGAGGRESGNNLKQRIHKVGDIPCDPQRERPDQTHHHPSQCDSHIPFPRKKAKISAPLQGKQHADGKRQESADQINRPDVFAIDQSDNHGQKQKHSLHPHDPPKNICNASVIHEMIPRFRISFFRQEYLRSHPAPCVW